MKFSIKSKSKSESEPKQTVPIDASKPESKPKFKKLLSKVKKVFTKKIEKQSSEPISTEARHFPTAPLTSVRAPIQSQPTLQQYRLEVPRVSSITATAASTPRHSIDPPSSIIATTTSTPRDSINEPSSTFASTSSTPRCSINEPTSTTGTVHHSPVESLILTPVVSNEIDDDSASEYSEIESDVPQRVLLLIARAGLTGTVYEPFFIQLVDKLETCYIKVLPNGIQQILGGLPRYIGTEEVFKKIGGDDTPLAQYLAAKKLLTILYTEWFKFLSRTSRVPGASYSWLKPEGIDGRSREV